VPNYREITRLSLRGRSWCLGGTDRKGIEPRGRAGGGEEKERQPPGSRLKRMSRRKGCAQSGTSIQELQERERKRGPLMSKDTIDLQSAEKGTGRRQEGVQCLRLGRKKNKSVGDVKSSEVFRRKVLKKKGKGGRGVDP